MNISNAKLFIFGIKALFLLSLSGCSIEGNSISDHDASETREENNYDNKLDSEYFFDGSGCPQFDSDQDTIPDFVEGKEINKDSDSDTVGDYLDEDSDNDTILDRHEAGDFDCNTPPEDSDGDTLPDYLDEDSDNDTIPDFEEAGDDILNSFPRDTDGLGVPDFQDIDSDNDGLSDKQERDSGTNPYNKDTDNDGFNDFEETASEWGDPLNYDKRVSPDENILTLWYKGRSIYRIFNAQVLFKKNDIFFAVDDTETSSETIATLKNSFIPILYPSITGSLDGVSWGLGVFSGWGIPAGIYPSMCFHPFYGIQTITDDVSLLASALIEIPSCPEPTIGSSVLDAISNISRERNDAHWLPDARICNVPHSIGAGCFRNDARRFIFVILEEDFPLYSPEGVSEPYTIDEIVEILNNKGIHIIGFVIDDNLQNDASIKISEIARAIGSVDRTMRPLVYAVGKDGSNLSSAIENAVTDISKYFPSDITLEITDGKDWPMDDNNYDATELVSTIYPRGWSPPPWVSPSEAVSYVNDLTYYKTIPGTEVSYKIYFRNNSREQDSTGHIFEVKIKIKNNYEYIFNEWSIKLLIPCISGDNK